MKSAQFLSILCVCIIAGCAPSDSHGARAKDHTVQNEPGASSPEELKTRFLQLYQANDVDAMLAMFYLTGASDRMVALYRNTVPMAKELTITSAEVLDISKE